MNLFEKIAKENDNSGLVNAGLGALTLGGLGAGAYYGVKSNKQQDRLKEIKELHEIADYNKKTSLQVIDALKKHKDILNKSVIEGLKTDVGRDKVNFYSEHIKKYNAKAPIVKKEIAYFKKELDKATDKYKQQKKLLNANIKNNYVNDEVVKEQERYVNRLNDMYKGWKTSPFNDSDYAKKSTTNDLREKYKGAYKKIYNKELEKMNQKIQQEIDLTKKYQATANKYKSEIDDINKLGRNAKLGLAAAGLGAAGLAGYNALRSN